MKKKKILVVDDDPNLLLVTRDLLELAGYEVLTQKQAFGTTNLVNMEQPDLVLLDINMPFISGDKLSELLLENEGTKNIPIIFYSSNDEETLRQQAKHFQVHGYICKGDLVKLKNEIRRFFKNHSVAS